MVEGDGVLAAGVLAAVRKTPAAGVGHFIAARRAVVARDVDDFDDVGVAAVAAHGELDPLRDDGALLIHAAAHGGHVARDDGLGDVRDVLQQIPPPRAARDFAQHLILQILYFCVECSAFLDVVHSLGFLLESKSFPPETAVYRADPGVKDPFMPVCIVFVSAVSAVLPRSVPCGSCPRARFRLSRRPPGTYPRLSCAAPSVSRS